MTRLEHALQLSDVGFYVFPLKPNSKKPALKGWPEEATRDRTKIAEWFSNDNRNIGIATEKFGNNSALIVIDVDVAKGKKGEASLSALHADIQLPPTRVHKTQSGGQHLIYTSDLPVKQGTNVLGPGLDTRSAGGYIVAPGSVINDHAYTVLTEGAMPSRAPQRLIERLGAARSRQRQREVGQPIKTPRDSLRQRAIAYLKDAPLAIEGSGGDTQTYAVAAMCLQFVSDEVTALELMLEHWNGRCSPPWERDDLARKIGNARLYSQNEPGSADPANVFDVVKPLPDKPTTGPQIKTICVAEVVPKAVRWLWHETFAFGKTSMIAGDPGLGKSQLTISLAATVSTGGLLPDNRRCELGNVIFLTAEDDIADTIRPRLEAAGADINRIHMIDCVQRPGENGQVAELSFNLARDMSLLQAKADAIGDVKLLIIDPISAFMGGADAHKNDEVRALLMNLKTFAEQQGAAVIIVHHLNKSSGSSAINRVSGSIGFVAAVRAAYVVTRDKDDEALRLMAPVKNNIGDDRTTYSFRVQSAVVSNDIQTSKVVWEGVLEDMSADDALGEAAKGSGEALQVAKNWLRAALLDGPKGAKEMAKAAGAQGISGATLRRARQQLGVIAKKEEGVQHGGFFWRLPDPVVPRTAEDIFA